MVAICFCLPALTISCQARSHIKLPYPARQTWDGSVTVAPDAPLDVATKANPVCVQLTADTRKHLAAVQALIVDIAKSKSAPPVTVYGTVKALAGHPVVDIDTKRKLQSLDREHKSVTQFNHMLTEARCMPVDIEHDAAQIPGR